MRIRLDGSPSFRGVVERTREAALRAYAHQDLPFERVVEELKVRRDPSYNPVFQVNFRAQSEERATLELPGIAVSPLAIDIRFSRFDLALELQRRGERYAGYVEYDLDLFEEETAAALAAEVETSLVDLVRHPERSVLELHVAPRWRGRRPAHGTKIARARQT